MNAADLIAATLADYEVGPVFALPGEENLALVEALADRDIELVVVRHEQHAAFMAATHGRLTGRPGVCLATLGPGALNLFTGLAHATLGGFPVVALTGQKPDRDNDEGPFQVVDVVHAAASVTVASLSVTDPQLAGVRIEHALHTAMRGRRGAVLVEVPEDVAAADVADRAVPHPVTELGTAVGAAPIDAAVRALRGHEVVVLAGGGAADAATASALARFADRCRVGVVTTQMGKGAFDERDPRSLRSLGIHRPDYSHLGLPHDADGVVLAVGYDPVEHPPPAWNPDESHTVVHLAPWSANRVAGYRPVVEMVGAIAPSLDLLAETLEAHDDQPTRVRAEVIDELLGDEVASDPGSFPPSPIEVVRAVQECAGPGGVVALDNGVYKIWFARHHRTVRPGHLLLDNALATMGAGLAAGMEAARLGTGEPVVVVTGDGGFLMNVQDLETAVRLGLDLVVVVVRDDAYGFIGWHQAEQDRDRRAVDLGNPDLVALAEAFGAAGHRVDPDNTLAALLTVAVEEGGPHVIDCPIDYTANEQLEADLLGRARRRLTER